MPTDRETILATLFADLGAALTAPTRRNDALPTDIPAAGLVIIRDGEPGEPVEVTMSPLRYHFEHRVEVEVFVQDHDGADTAFDGICVEIGQVITGDRTLGGLCDWIETGAPETEDMAIEGAASVKAGIVPLILHYAVSDPLA